MKRQKLIIAFSPKTNKFWAKIICKKYKHCCVIFKIRPRDWILVQIGTDGVRPIPINLRGFKTLKKNGWDFVEAEIQIPRRKIPILPGLLTCVGFAKRAIGLRALFVWTPDGLYRKIKN